LAEYFEHYEQPDEICLQVGYSQRYPRIWPRFGSLFVEAAAGCESGIGGQLPIGLPQRVAGARTTSTAFATRGVWEQMMRDAALRDDDC
jgi:hypothetical protein